MDRFIVPLLGALIGAGAGTFAARALSPDAGPAPASAEVRGGEDVRTELAEIRRLLEKPGLATAPAAPSSSGASAPAARGAGDGMSASPEVVEALAAKIAVAMEERRLAAEKAAKEARETKRKRVALAEAARELELTATQENEVRRAHEDYVEKMLKLMAEPEQDAESLRRELIAAKNDQNVKRALIMKRLPKLLGKLPDVMGLEAERETRIQSAVGADKASKLKEYQLEEADPYGVGGGGEFNIGVRSGN